MIRYSGVLAATLVVSLLLPSQARAQLSTVTFGSRVRIITPATSGNEGSVHPGLMRAVSGDTVMLQTAAGPIDTVVMRPAMKLERWSGTHGNGGIGLLAGFIVGYAYGSGRKDPDSPGFVEMLDGIAGGFLGLVIGLAIQTDSWTPVPSSGVRVVLGPNGVGMRLSLGSGTRP